MGTDRDDFEDFVDGYTTMNADSYLILLEQINRFGLTVVLVLLIATIVTCKAAIVFVPFAMFIEFCIFIQPMIYARLSVVELEEAI